MTFSRLQLRPCLHDPHHLRMVYLRILYISVNVFTREKLIQTLLIILWRGIIKRELIPFISYIFCVIFLLIHSTTFFRHTVRKESVTLLTLQRRKWYMHWCEFGPFQENFQIRTIFKKLPLPKSDLLPLATFHLLNSILNFWSSHRNQKQ